MRLVQSHPDWLLGFEDEVWWSRVSQPHLHAWTADGQPLRRAGIPQTPPRMKRSGCASSRGGR